MLSVPLYDILSTLCLAREMRGHIWTNPARGPLSVAATNSGASAPPAGDEPTSRAWEAVPPGAENVVLMLCAACIGCEEGPHSVWRRIPNSTSLSPTPERKPE